MIPRLLRMIVSGFVLSVALGVSPVLGYDVNKDLQNLGPDAKDLTVILSGTETVSNHFDGYTSGSKQGRFGSFATGPTMPNTEMRWRNFNDGTDDTIDTGQTIHIGWSTADHDSKVLDMYWTDGTGERIAGSVVYNTTTEWRYETKKQIVFVSWNNDFSPGDLLPEETLTLSDVACVVRPTPIDLADLNTENSTLAAELDTAPLQLSTVVLAPGEEQSEEIPATVANGSAVVCRYGVTATGTAAQSLDFVQFIATALENDEQKCLNAANKGAAKIVKAQGKDICDCIKNGSKGKLTGTIEDCLTSDPKGKVAKAKSKYDSKAGNCDAGFIALADKEIVKQAAMDKDINLIHWIFGSDTLDNVIADASTDKDKAKCQKAVTKAAFKCEDEKLKAYNKCKKDELKGKNGPAIASAQELQDRCMGIGPGTIPDPKGKVEKTCNTKLLATINKKCTAPFPVCFPGCPDAATAADLRDCVDYMIECEVCRYLNIVDGLQRDCDLFDNGVSDGSCSPVTDSECDAVSCPAEANYCRYTIEEVDGSGCGTIVPPPGELTGEGTLCRQCILGNPVGPCPDLVGRKWVINNAIGNQVCGGKITKQLGTSCNVCPPPPNVKTIPVSN